MGYHDAAEDHGGMLRLKDIEHNFGKNVARMVEGLSDSLTDDPGNKQSWQTRKESYIERLRDPRPRAVYGTDTLFTLAENSPNTDIPTQIEADGIRPSSQDIPRPNP